MTELSAPQIGPILQRQRKARGLTLQQLAAVSGVSKSMLSQIERGEANPTFAVLWSLTRGLQIEISALLQGSESSPGGSAIEIVPPEHTPEIRSADGSCQLRILSPPSLAGTVEWYDVEIAGHGRLDSAAHAPGAVEHFTVLSGQFVIASGASRYPVKAGETARYPVDVPHSICNELDQPARGLMVLLYQKVRQERGST
ncbi:helix-turn-helix domain-containing protein [Bosea sp. BIWAKO-01]|uniref:helix-turn-helix domain-containing protein n=1 Tax=Bosea sp. BIWAKO-01 TaxID=506668 RepID=UPI0008537B65|nr:XRE family transcriptional regulator [Bosea sp. BIWAKO-01]GAU85808.1 transcriptional regulator [Bosea sp. BIWAKO-01]